LLNIGECRAPNNKLFRNQKYVQDFWNTLSLYFYSRQQLRGVLVHLVEPRAHVLAKVCERLLDVPQPREAGRLVLLLPRLDVDEREAGVKRVLKVLERKSSRVRGTCTNQCTIPGTICLQAR
jgi:hypothetical protein